MAAPATTSRTLVPVYDYSVLWFSNTFVWRCPTPHLLAWYNRHIRGTHLDVGPGSGYFLDHCTFPVSHPSVMLLDPNPRNLTRAATRIARYQPQTYVADARHPLSIAQPVESVGLNYVLHVVPGSLEEKGERIFAHLRAVVCDGGVVFGSTILGEGVSHTRLAQRFLRFYHAKGIFHNAHDTPDALDAVLRRHFQSHELHLTGSVARFVGRT